MPWACDGVRSALERSSQHTNETQSSERHGNRVMRCFDSNKGVRQEPDVRTVFARASRGGVGDVDGGRVSP